MAELKKGIKIQVQGLSLKVPGIPPGLCARTCHLRSAYRNCLNCILVVEGDEEADLLQAGDRTEIYIIPGNLDNSLWI